MTKEQIAKLAKQSGFTDADENSVWITDGFWTLELQRFAALVRADEREQCAKVCEENGKEPDDHKAHEGYEEGYQDGSNNCAAAIRARGQG